MSDSEVDWERGGLVGWRLRCARLRCGMPQQQAAVRLGLHRNTVHAIERDASGLRLDLAERMCALYGITLVWLLRPEDAGGPAPG